MKKKYLGLIAVVVVLLGCNISMANTIEEAMGDVDIYCDGTTMNYLIAGRGVQNLKYAYYRYPSEFTGEVKEVPAYCVNPSEPGVGQVGSYTVNCSSLASDPKLVGIISNGYPRQDLSVLNLRNKYEGYYATKIALWSYLINGWDINKVKVNPNCSDQDAANRVLNAAKTIYNNGVTWTSTIEPILTAIPVTSTAIEDKVNNKYLSQEFIVKANTYLPNGAIAVRFANSDKVPDGVKIVDSLTNQPITQFGVSQDGDYLTGKFKVLYPKDVTEEESGQVQIELQALQYRYVVYYGISYDEEKQDYLCDTDPSYISMASAVSSYSPKVELDDGTWLKILKYETGTQVPLEGAVFEVINPSGATIGRYTTNAYGEINIPLNITGNFTIKEISPPKGYLTGENSTQNVEVVYNEIAEVTFYNTRYGELTIEKVDSKTGRGLSGATIKVTHIESGNSQTIKTRASGVVQLEELLPGGYEVQEITPPSGYVLDDTVHTINVTAGNVSNIVLKNTPTPSLRIIKFDRATNAVLPNATFEVYKDAELIGEYVTDEMGEILLTDLEPGTYLAREIDSPEGYVIDDYFQQIEVKSGETAELVFFNLVKPGIGLVKIDSNSMESLPNAIFEIKQVGGAFEEERTTDELGRIDLSDLEPATYQVREIQAPKGYVIDNHIRTIKLNAGETNVQFIFTNTEKPDLKVIKVSSKTKETIAGATFSIGKVGETPREYRTNSDGIIYLDSLEPGVYSVVETKAPNGYILDGIERIVELFPGRLSQLVYDNDEQPKLQVIKTNMQTGEPIEGTKFRVNKSDGSTIGIFTTDSNGQFLIDKLDEGVYTVTEVYVPEEYMLDTTPQSITLFANKTGVLQFENQPKASLTIIKLDTISNSPLENAYFDITRKDSDSEVSIGEYTTDENGKIALYNLIPGRYLIKEIKAPRGYKSIEETKEIIITDAENKVVKFTNDALSPLYIKKINEKTNEPIEGVKFKVTEMNGTLIGEYKTDHYGFVCIPEIEPGWYTVTEIDVPDGYVLDNTAKTIEVQLGKPAIVEFCNSPYGSLKIEKTDKHTGKALEKAQFELTRIDGSLVGDKYYETDVTGVIIFDSLEPGYYIVREIQAPDGYILVDEEMTVEVESGKLKVLKFTNEAVAGLKIVKTITQTGEPLKGVKFKVEKIDGTRIGTYTTNKNGLIYVPLEPGWYTVTETYAPEGYAIDKEVKNVEVLANIPTILEVENMQLSGIRVKKVDSETGEGIYGVRFLVKDAKHNIIGQYTTNQDGYIDLSYELEPGKYTIEEISTVDGYVLDTEEKTIKVRAGYTEEIIWENEPIKGQIQITKISEDTNSINGLPMNSLLEGAYFEIYDKAGNTVDTVYTDKNGLAISKPLPLGIYTIREIKAPNFYKASDDIFTTNLEYAGQIVKFIVTNKSLVSGVEINKVGYKEVMPNQPIRYTFTAVSNTSNVSLDSFYFRDKLPFEVQLEKIVTGTFNHTQNYKILYMTNLSYDYNVLADNLSTAKNYVFDTSNVALGLANGEYITEVMFVFGTVQPGFSVVEKPYFECTTLNNLISNTAFVNVADVGGLLNNEWIMAVSRWVTNVYSNYVYTLPKTGY